MTPHIENAPVHPIVEKPWTWQIIGISFRCAPESQRDSELELTLWKDGTSVTLRFTTVYELRIDEGFPWHSAGLQILDTSSSQMEDCRVRVTSFEQDGGIHFWAKAVERADT